MNKDFLWTESYHHYDDWKTKMEGVYDQFNLLQMPHANRNEPKLYFNHGDFKRRVPKGIFPFPSHKRSMLEQPQQLVQNKLESQSMNDDIVKFERSPMQFMVKQELEKARQLGEITPELSMITNL